MNHIHRQGQWQRNGSPCGEGNAVAHRAPTDCLLAEQIRLLAHAACVARIGAAQMTLGDWRDVEQGVKQKLENEKHKTTR